MFSQYWNLMHWLFVCWINMCFCKLWHGLMKSSWNRTQRPTAYDHFFWAIKCILLCQWCLLKMIKLDLTLLHEMPQDSPNCFLATPDFTCSLSTTHQTILSCQLQWIISLPIIIILSVVLIMDLTMRPFRDFVYNTSWCLSSHNSEESALGHIVKSPLLVRSISQH